ncbi:unknown protein [Microcystis aeruginosa NIES-843]|uniref:Uncharacterized protein n=1 Tax=Microcystis aeruginosa (strain NIES-843 / IAM M-2473) TaxID=449447 RepID=B0JXE7_MICAN|nr:unknown protein [Microcystis aeruginosa NIES-843]
MLPIGKHRIPIIVTKFCQFFPKLSKGCLVKRAASHICRNTDNQQLSVTLKIITNVSAAACKHPTKKLMRSGVWGVEPPKGLD